MIAYLDDFWLMAIVTVAVGAAGAAAAQPQDTVQSPTCAHGRIGSETPEHQTG